MWQDAPGQENALTSTADRTVSKLDGQGAVKPTALLYKDTIDKSTVIPVSQNVSCVLGQESEDDAPML